MKKVLSTVVLGALLSITAFVPAQAEQVNIAKFTCGEFLKLSKENQIAVAGWAAGLLTAELKQQQPAFDLTKFAPVTQKIADGCKGKDKTPFSSTAMEQLMYLGDEK